MIYFIINISCLLVPYIIIAIKYRRTFMDHPWRIIHISLVFGFLGCTLLAYFFSIPFVLSKHPKEPEDYVIRGILSSILFLVCFMATFLKVPFINKKR